MSVWMCPVFWNCINIELILVSLSLKRPAAYISKLGNACCFVQSLASPVVNVFLFTNKDLCQAQGNCFQGVGLTCALSPPYPERGVSSHIPGMGGGGTLRCLFTYRDGNEARLEFKPNSIWFGGLALGLHEAGAQRPPRPGFKALSASSYINVGRAGKTDLGFLPTHLLHSK